MRHNESRRAERPTADPFLPTRNDKEEQIHHLFNRLHRALVEFGHERTSAYAHIASQVDAAHHDFTAESTSDHNPDAPNVRPGEVLGRWDNNA